jgi:hypothetical protein
MKFIDISFDGKAEDAVKFISDNNSVNSGVVFDESRGVPTMRVKEKPSGKIKITCELVGGPTRDNGFFVGTYFSGRITETSEGARLKGVITTAPIYHAFLIILIGVFIFQCIRMGGFSVVPPIIVAFDVLMFWKEFKKQGYIERYLKRAQRRMRSE